MSGDTLAPVVLALAVILTTLITPPALKWSLRRKRELTTAN
jgi:hypothetical protein